MATSLPSRPDLERFRRDARALRRAVRARDTAALELAAVHHPDGAPTDPSTFPLSAAQLVLARRYGLSSWPKLVAYLDASKPWTRNPPQLSTTEFDPGDTFAALACLTYSEVDDPARWRRAADLLEAEPMLPSRSLVAAAAAGDAEAVRRHLDTADPSVPAGPFGWVPLLYLVYSRVRQVDPLLTAKLLLAAGSDPDSGYLWQGLPSPFTALTGCFGEGEQGPGRQPRHPQGEQLAGLLLERGADPNDGQTLYNRMFGRDDSHLRLLFGYGLGTGDGGVWRRRLGEAVDTPTEMLQRQADWAADHGFVRRLALLAERGYVPTDPTDDPVGLGAAPDIHRAGTPENVQLAVEHGADVDALRDGRTALHHHAWIGDVDMVIALLAAGADPTLKDETYRSTPFEWARHGHQPNTAALLDPARINSAVLGLE